MRGRKLRKKRWVKLIFGPWIKNHWDWMAIPYHFIIKQCFCFNVGKKNNNLSEFVLNILTNCQFFKLSVDQWLFNHPKIKDWRSWIKVGLFSSFFILQMFAIFSFCPLQRCVLTWTCPVATGFPLVSLKKLGCSNSLAEYSFSWNSNFWGDQ